MTGVSTEKLNLRGMILIYSHVNAKKGLKKVIFRSLLALKFYDSVTIWLLYQGISEE